MTQKKYNEALLRLKLLNKKSKSIELTKIEKHEKKKMINIIARWYPVYQKRHI